MKAKEIIKTLKEDGATTYSDMLAALCDGEYLAKKGWNQEDVEDAHLEISEIISLLESQALGALNLPLGYLYIDGHSVKVGLVGKGATDDEIQAFRSKYKELEAVSIYEA
jgi:hypothetical protein